MSILLNNSERLGIKDQAIIKKADEYLRILQSKPASKAINDVAKPILCLDLASSNIGSVFDKETAIQLTGLRKTAYQNSLNNVEKILDLDKPLSVSELCVQLGCLSVKDTAENILRNYVETDIKIKDSQHPQYVAAAVYTACKLTKVKLEKSKILSVSRLKSVQWKELTEEFNKLTTNLGITAKRKQRTTAKSDNKETQDLETEAKAQQKRGNKDDEVVEDYETWRERIIKEAQEEIKKRGNSS